MIPQGDNFVNLPTPVKRSTVLEPLSTTLPKKAFSQDLGKSSTKWSAQETSILQNM